MTTLVVTHTPFTGSGRFTMLNRPLILTMSLILLIFGSGAAFSLATLFLLNPS
jgi:hypothetical protein